MEGEKSADFTQSVQRLEEQRKELQGLIDAQKAELERTGDPTGVLAERIKQQEKQMAEVDLRIVAIIEARKS